MHDPRTGEAAYPLSDAMITALSEIAGCDCRSAFVANLGTARALVQRGFIEPALHAQRERAGEPGTLYRLTERGATALRIVRRSQIS